MNFELTQIVDTIDLGLIVLDRDLTVRVWNSWMERHSKIPAQEIIGTSILERFPNLSNSKYTRLIKSVLKFGSYARFSQKLHRHIIPLINPHASSAQLPFMQQNCTANPVRDADGKITGLYIAIHDVTEYVTYENRLLEMTKLDPLTRLFNRSYLDQRFTAELERARRHGTTFSVIMIDIDHFKKINDLRGHLCGDLTLRQFAAILQQTVRTMDVVGRYGGEEFCCLLPETFASDAGILAERLRINVETSEFVNGAEKFRITISLGVAEYSEKTSCLETIVGAADAALYRAKNEGRNRVIYADDCLTSRDNTGDSKL